MLMVLSPAKTLDYESPLPPAFQALEPELTRPAHVAEAERLIECMRQLSAAEVAELMELSPALADLNVQRFKAWRPRHTAHNSRAAVLAFNGDVYEGLDARSLGADVLRRAQQRLRILSGLYGILRPLDRLQPYRLEMGRPVQTPTGKGLYAFWGTRLAEELNALGAQQRSPLLINLASQEYFKAVNRKALRLPVLELVFEEVKDGGPKVISFFAKRARGLMARFVLEQDLDHPDDLRAFDREGYAWVQAASSPERWVFRREGVPS
ncbi:peroxide stress protein YaaA [Inhella proteolytica]|uniref:UPF0246 protein I7X39_17240 n=1 Tax=Inhella proteolytica TaxID=2795029 RepID=A0A931J9P6_9BURK|nr:peroxide stress protein YaaA [Inhella proteolytica]MBH9578640.1 peroxide stress protein YaaA [Inhella proteolytica]